MKIFTSEAEAWQDRAQTAEAEVERLKHDVERHMDIASKSITERERLREVLEELVSVSEQISVPDKEIAKASYYAGQSHAVIEVSTRLKDMRAFNRALLIARQTIAATPEQSLDEQHRD